MQKMKPGVRFLFLLTLLCIPVFSAEGSVKNDFRPVCDSVEKFMAARCWCQYPVNIHSAKVLNRGKKNEILVINASKEMAFFPFRDGDIEHIHEIFSSMMPGNFSKYSKNFRIETNGKNLKAYGPAYFKEGGYPLYIKEHKAIHRNDDSCALVSCVSAPCKPDKGLTGSHIALWQSHGMYYNTREEKWKWQRGHIFGTVEDAYTQSYVIPFLAPMLENAGATVLMPRERDINSNETIVDNDDRSGGYSEHGKWNSAPGKGFRNSSKKKYLRGENPFEAGTARMKKCSKGSRDEARWTPDIPEKGEYAVYVSYKSLPTSARDAQYEVSHSGGKTTFLVNQKMGGGTWIYLGTFNFNKGNLPEQYVRLLCRSTQEGATVSADAVRFGGGKGNVARSPEESGEPEISGHPRYNEAATYWLQWAGFNDSIYSPSHFCNDYKDDIHSRGNWVNALKKDYNVPIDLSLAFHSDAGLRKNDSIVGTLAIHCWEYENSRKYSNGERRFLGRDFADIVQTSVVSEIRASYDSTWTRRGLWDCKYRECSSPQVPSMILELLSHQNFNDMRYGLDPGFRFTVSRGVYKGILTFLSWLNDKPCIVQPLPVKGFSVSLDKVSGRHYAVLGWLENEDPTDASAKAEGYIIYKRIGDGGFDNGIYVESRNARVEIEPGKLYSFRVAAVNSGGRSFPSETLCAAVPKESNGKKCLIVNNFTRISGPESFFSSDSLQAGFRYDLDAGVPYLYDICYCGNQYEFMRDAEWQSDDYPGFGASENDYDSGIMAGNTFDFVSVHAEALLKAGCSIASSSREALLNGVLNMNDYHIADIICGKQKKGGEDFLLKTGRDYSIFPQKLRDLISIYAGDGHKLIVSGAHIASEGGINDILHIRHTDAENKGSGEITLAGSRGRHLEFHTKPNPEVYHIERPDGLKASGPESDVILYYTSSGVPAGVRFKSPFFSAVSLGFPIEALENREQREYLLIQLLEMLQ